MSIFYNHNLLLTDKAVNTFMFNCPDFNLHVLVIHNSGPLPPLFTAEGFGFASSSGRKREKESSGCGMAPALSPVGRNHFPLLHQSCSLRLPSLSLLSSTASIHSTTSQNIVLVGL